MYYIRFTILGTTGIKLMMAGCLLGGLPLHAEETTSLPIAGVEFIDHGSTYSASGGGPVGDPEPEKGTGNQLVDDDGTVVPLDCRGNSLVVDLGQIQRVEAVRIHASKPAEAQPFENLLKEPLEVYTSEDNRQFRKIENPKQEIDPTDGSTLLLSGFQMDTRFIKVHSRYRGDAYRVSGKANTVIGVDGKSGPLAGHRVILDFGLLQRGANRLKISQKSIGSRNNLKYHFELWPYLRGPGVAPIESGNLTLSSEASEQAWAETSLQIASANIGFHQLRITCVDQDSGEIMWDENLGVRMVGAIRKAKFPIEGPLSGPAEGEALVIEPAATGELSGGWRIGSSEPNWPLWTLPRNRIAGMVIPVSLSGVCAVYVGVRGSAAPVEIKIGNELCELISSAGRSEEAINEAFFGILPEVQTHELAIRSKISPADLEISYIKILSLTPEQAKLASGETKSFPGRKLIFYCDGYSIHGGLRKPSNFTAEKFEAQADRFRDSGDIVERYDYCQGTSSVISSHLSKVPTTEYPGQTGNNPTKYSEFVSKNFKENFLDKGLNPIEVMGRRFHEWHVPVYAAYRMNAWYDEPVDKHYVSTFWRAHPEFRVQPFRGKIWAARSYAYPEVRKFNLEVMKEMLGLGVDGVHLEFMRHPPFVGYDAPLVESFRIKYGKSPFDPDFNLWVEWKEAQTEVMTSFLREVRAMLDEEGKKQGKHFGLSVRFDYRKYRAESLDVEGWVKEGLVDTIVPGDDKIRNRRIDLAPFLELARGTGVRVYSSLSPEETGTRDPTPDDDARGVPPPQGLIPTSGIKEFVADAFRQGAEGVYMFNNSGLESYRDWQQFRTLETWDQYENPRNLVKLPYHN